MAITLKASPADRFRTPASVATWHIARRLLRGRGYRPETDETAESLPQAFRLDPPPRDASDKSKTTKP